MVRPIRFSTNYKQRTAEPLPLLLVLGPLMTQGPWTQAVARAASTLQLPEEPQLLGDTSARTALEYGLLVQRIQRIVLCAEGHGAPAGPVAAAIEARTRAITAALGSLGGAADTPVDALFFDRLPGRLLARVARTERYLPVERVDGCPLLWELVRPEGPALGPGGVA